MKKNSFFAFFIVIVIILVGVLVGFMIYKNIVNNNYVTKCEYYLMYVNEHELDNSDDDLKGKDKCETAAYIMYDYYLIEKNQMSNLNKPVTKEIVAQSIVNDMEFRTEHNIEIKDIKKCEDKQAIIDSVGMGIFEIKDNKFYPNKYMTLEEIQSAMEKAYDIEMHSDYENDEYDIEYKDNVNILEEDIQIYDFSIE